VSDKTSNSPANYILLTRLADEFAARYRAGERPSLQEYIDRHPALAEDIRELFPAMVEIEQVKEDHQNAAGQAQAPTAPALRQLGDFRMLRQVGKGGMGIVYEAEQVSLGRHVALKVLPKNMLLDLQAKRRFEREAKSAAKLHHTNIVPVFGVGEHDGLPYYVMQYIQGLGLDAVLDGLNHIKPGGSTALAAGEVRFSGCGTTAAEMARSLMTGAFPHAKDSLGEECTLGAVTVGFDAPGQDEDTGLRSGDDATLAASPSDTDTPHSVRLSDSFNLSASSLSFPGPSSGVSGRKTGPRKETYWHRVANIGRQVADALDYAHKQGILHRDVKPSNLLLDMRGTVWVTDFGLAKVAGPGADDLTHTGDIVGTLRYMPPESFEGKSDARSDVYSLGLTLYELLAMRPAFAEKDRNKLIKMVTAEEPMRLDKVKPEIPRDLVTIVQKTIEKEPGRRYATAEELAADLQRYIDDEPILARRQTELERCVRWARHNPGIAALCAVLAAVLVTATIASVIVAGRMARTAANEERERARAEEAKTIAEKSSAKAREAERLARAAEEEGRKLLYTTDMQLAPFVWRDDRSTAEVLRMLLAKHIPSSFRSDLRGFEWYYYQHLLGASAAVFSGHGFSVVDGAFATDGELVTLDQSAQLRRWDLVWQHENEAGRRDLPDGLEAQIRVLSPDGRLAAVAEGNNVRVFDTSTGNEKLSLDSVEAGLRRIIFARDGDRLVIVDDKIRWLSASSGEVIASVDHKFDNVSAVTLSGDGLTLAVVGHGGMSQFVSTFRFDATAKTVTALAKDFGAGGTLSAAALSPEGRRIAVGAKLSGSMLVYDTATGRELAKHGSAHASPIRALAFSDDGTRLATADAEGTIKIWADLEKLNSKSTALLTKKGHQGAINTARFSTDGRRLVTTCADKTARVWDVENAGAAIWPLEANSNSGTLVARFSPDGQLIAAADGNNIRLWNAANGRLARELSPGGKARVFSVAFSPTDSRLLAVGYGGEDDVSYVALWDIDAGTELARLPGATDLPNFQVTRISGPVAALAFSPDGKNLVAGFGSKNTLTRSGTPTPPKVWEVASRRLIRRLNGPRNYCVSLDFSRDGTVLASGSRDGTATLWSTATWIKLQTLENQDKDSMYPQSGLPAMVEDVVFSPNGKTLAMASRAGSVQLWDVATGKHLETLKGHSGAVSAVAFSPDGRTLASGSHDQTVRLWNTETRRELMQLDPGNIELGYVQTLAFSPDGKRLLAGGNGTAIWGTAPNVWNDPDRAALELRLLLHSNADFPSRIRMLSENLRLHEALAKLDGKEKRVQAALAATQANWHASRKAWPQAVAAFDRLMAVDPAGPDAWLRTPGLLRLATALLQENRPAVAAILLQGGAKRSAQDGVPAIVGIGEQLNPLRAAVNERLATAPRDTGLLELRAELAGQWSDTRAQAADYTAAIEAISRRKPRAAAADLERLYGRRGNAYVALQEWQKAIDDYARTITDSTTDDALLTNQALAMAESLLSNGAHVLVPTSERDGTLTERRLAATRISNPWAKLAAAHQLRGDQEAIDRLVDRRRNLAGPIGDLFTQGKNEQKNWRRAISLYSKGITAEKTDVVLLSKRARAHEALKNWDAAAADWSRAAAKNPDGPKLLADFARRLAKGGVTSLANEQFEKSRALHEAALQADPENDLVVPELANLLWDLHENEDPTPWTVLKPMEMKSAGGATLLKLDDDSILAGGVNPPSDEYTVAFYVPERTAIHSIRLEAFLHDSLPGKGPGRSTKGYEGVFALFRWELTAQGPDGADSPQLFRFHTACADYSWRGDVLSSIGEWNISSGSGKDHTSVWNLQKPVTLEAGTLLRSRMRFNTNLDWGDQNLGRFRISVSGDPAVFEREQTRFAAMKPASPWLKLAAAYAGNRKYDLAARYFNPAIERAPDYEARKPIIELASLFDDLVPVLIERWPDEPQLQVALARQFAGQGKKHLTLKQPAQAQAELEKARAVITRLRGKAPEPQWTVLKPTELKSERGTILTLQGDGSITASGKNPNQDTYILTAAIAGEPIGGLRLETIPDSDFNGAAGRVNGEFHLTEIEAAVSAPGGGTDHHLAIKDGFVDFYPAGYPVSHAFDHDNLSSWGIWTRMSEPHTAVFEFQSLSPAVEGSQRFKVRLYSGASDAPQRNLGRFRLSVTHQALGLMAAVRLRHDFNDSDLLELNVDLAKAHAQQGHTNEAVTSFTEALRLAANRAAKAKIIAEAASGKGVLEKLAERAAGDAQFLAELARHYAVQGNPALAR
jgi:eukaryotic-like serine/threonine-protein kinase